MENWPKLRGISRLDYESVPPGWRARYTREGITFSEDFYDSKFASPEAALEAAKKWHERARSYLPPIDRREYAQLKRVTNKSGHVGVYRASGVAKGHTYWYWFASWSPEKGKKKFKRFSISKYGEEGAKKMAIEARAKAIAELDAEWPEEYWDYRRNTDGSSGSKQKEEEAPWKDIYGFEGSKQHKEHLCRERDRSLRFAKIEQFLGLPGQLFCEVCGFSFEHEYGQLGKGLIEIHHTLPIAQMEEGHRTRLEDLICICGNCHLAVHNGDAYTNLQILRFIYSSKKKNNKSNRVPGSD